MKVVLIVLMFAFDAFASGMDDTKIHGTGCKSSRWSVSVDVDLLNKSVVSPTSEKQA